MKWRVGYLVFVCLFAASFTHASERPSVTPQDVFDSMRANFRADKATGIHARYQFELSGPHGGAWLIEVQDGRCQIQRAKIPNPDVVVSVSDKDWVALSNDQLAGPWAYLTGRLKVRGNHLLARKLDELFP